MSLFKKYVINTIIPYLNSSPIEMRYAKTYYSQFGEDVVVEQFFKKKNGFYVDVGAYHPFQFSNTYLLYKKGWSGINIEPNPHGFRLLARFRRRDRNVNCAVSDESGHVDFVESRAYSRIVGPEERETGRTIRVLARPLREIIWEQIKEGESIDLMSVDCEGHDLRVLRSNDWEKYRPVIVIVEDHDLSRDTEIDIQMKDWGYNFSCRMGLSKIFASGIEM